MTTTIPTPEQYPTPETYMDQTLVYEELTWQHPETVQAGDAVRITDRNHKVMIFTCHSLAGTATGAEGSLATYTPDLALESVTENARLTLAHPAPALRAAGVRFVELELIGQESRTRFQPLIKTVEKAHVPQLAAAVRYDAWQSAASEALTDPVAQTVLERAAQHLEEKARVERDANRFHIAAQALRELQE